MTQETPQASSILSRLILLALAGGVMVTSACPEWHVWGLDTARSFPNWLRALLFALLCLSLWPKLSRLLANRILQAVCSLGRSGGFVSYIPGFGLLLGLLILLSSNNHLLGDGYTLLGLGSSTPILSPTEPLDYLLHLGVGRIIPSTADSLLWSYRVCAYFAGLSLAVFFLHRLRECEQRIIALVVILCFPAIQFFFGYVESYTYSFLLSVLFLTSATDDLQHRAVSARSAALLILAIGFHLSAAVFLPVMGLLLLARFRARAARVVVFGLGLLAVAAAFVWAKMKLQLGEIFVPILPGGDSPYLLLSPDHLVDVLNLILLHIPLLLILLPGIRMLDRQERLLAVVALVPAFLFTMVIDPKISALRDWDLLSTLAAPALLISLRILIRRYQSDRPGTVALLLPILILAFLHTGGWIYGNTERDSAYAYTKPVVQKDLHYSGDYHRGYRNKAWANLVFVNLADTVESFRALEVRFAAAPDDDQNRLNLAMAYHLQMGRDDLAGSLMLDHWQPFVNSAQHVLDIGAIFNASGHDDERERMFRAFIDSCGVNRHVFYNYGVLLERKGDARKALEYYLKSLRIWPDMPIETALRICHLAIRQGAFADAADELEQLRTRIGPRSRPAIDQLIVALRSGDDTEIERIRYMLFGPLDKQGAQRRSDDSTLDTNRPLRAW